MDTFQTKTDAGPYTRKTGCIMAAVGLLLVGGIAYFSSGNLILCGAVAALYIAIAALTILTSNRFVLEFRGRELHVSGKTKRQSYVVYDTPASDFVITQTPKQKEKDTCTLKIRNTMFNFYDVEQCEALKEYIKSHLAVGYADDE